MKNHEVYQHPTGGYEAVKQGYNWPAFYFTFIWAFIKQLWVVGVGIIVGLAAIAVVITYSLDLESGPGPITLILAIQIIFYTYIGYKGNEWWKAGLEKRGFVSIGSTEAGKGIEAIRKLSGSDV